MTRPHPAGLWLAALALVLSAGTAYASGARLDTLVERLETWLDAHAPWPRRAVPPAIRIVPAEAARRDYGAAGYMGGRLRAYYDDATATITLVAPWNAADPADRSVLLHELAHHRQAPHHWVCEAAQELPAYKLQAAYAEQNGAQIRINWIAATLESGCRRRDVHPD